MKKETIIFLGIALILVVATVFYFYPQLSSSTQTITNYDECVAAGFPALKIYPGRCTANGHTFIQEVDGKRYVGTLEQCQTIRFTCEPGKESFFDEIGCGCQNIQTNPAELEDYFVEQIWKVGTENLGAMPVEGFNPELYKGAFPMFEDYDFHDTKAIGGTWKFQNDKLIFVKETSDISTADGTLTNEGVKKLYNNLKIRVDLKLESKEDIDNLLEFLSQKEQNVCSPESRNVQACTMDYNPVCGYVQVQCITTPCDPVPQTFSNSCGACANENVLYWTQGECPT